ncbi:hypothetical protein QJ857_gp0020 [Tupanvirus soda lake]|uniref:Cap-specific mRNA (nucleoside-2'-O-)-methyltransferase n=2 Tax=Tupanvirus TaxID=2094720 RepID=A0A6N1NI21_9VIRU|nr:hypothetical protein QJ857_gp0020 [Tupanvirus soda lake]QKU34669.1 hypothetical protein [Tupanvirus soda lake]
MITYKYSQIANNHRTSYKKSLELCKGKVKLHLGQLKLFFTELLFLTIHARKNDRVLYVGAAPGYHITKLAALFPEVNFDLWDPRQFEVESRPNIRLFNYFFTDDAAHTYTQNKERILFMCDMRTTKISKLKKQIEKMDEIVDDDMNMQRKWCQIIKPAYAYLKFRLPYGIPKTKYLPGTIYLQPYTKISTECRLMTNNYEENILYDNIAFEEKLAYHNGYTRCNSKHYNKFKKIMEKNDINNNWDNALALHITHFYLKNIKNDNTMEAVEKLYMDIIDYHIKKYGNKYNVIFKITKP